MSGRRPDRTKAWDFEHHFRAPGVGTTWTSLPGRFKEAGYFTTGVGKLFHPNLPPNADGAKSWTDTQQYPITLWVVPKGPDPVPSHWHSHNGPQCVNTSSGRRLTGVAGRQCGLINQGGPQGPELFDDMDANLADLALERLKVGAGLWHSRGRVCN